MRQKKEWLFSHLYTMQRNAAFKKKFMKTLLRCCLLAVVCLHSDIHWGNHCLSYSIVEAACSGD